MKRPPRPARASLVLAALPIIEAAARLGSFTKAGDELGLTQGAVSRRVQALEAQLGVVLFLRRGRAIRLTADGLLLAEAASEVVHRVEALRHDLSGPLTGSLRIGALPPLGGLWLAPRLKAFRDLHPGLGVTVSTVDADFSAAHKDPVRWDPSALEVVLTWGHGGWKGLESRLLMPERILAACTPAFRARHGIEAPADLWGAPRILHTTRKDAWEGFGAANGLAMLRDGEACLALEHFFMIREAALHDAGSALLPEFLIAGELRRGELVQVGPAWLTGSRYYAVGTASAVARPATRALLDWLPAEQ